MAWKGALVKKASSQVGVDYTSDVTVTFDTDVYDTDAWHDTSSNTSRMTVPSGVTRVRLSANIYFSAATSTQVVTAFFKKNGSELTASVYQHDPVNSTNPRKQLISYIDECTAGDYYEFVANAGDATVNVIEFGTWFAIEEIAVPAIAYSGAVVKKAADQTAANYTGIVAVAFDAEVHDVGGWHDNVTNNSRLTVPSGVTRIRLQGQVSLSSATAGDHFAIMFAKNGTDITPEVWCFKHTLTTASHVGVSYVVSCTAGDYFTMKLWVLADTSVTVVADETWFAIQKVE